MILQIVDLIFEVNLHYPENVHDLFINLEFKFIQIIWVKFHIALILTLATNPKYFFEKIIRNI